MSELFPDNANMLRSWLLSPDARRQGFLFLASTTLFFAVGAALALALHFELLTPGADRFSAETYGALFTMHGFFMTHLFILPALFGVLGNLRVVAPVSGKSALPWLGLLGWYLHLGGGAVLLWVLASGDVTGVRTGTALAVAGVLLTGINLLLSALRGKKRWTGLLRGEGAAERAFVRSGMLVAAVGAVLGIALIAWRGWGPLQGTYFEVGSRHLLLGGVGLGIYFGRLHWRWPQLSGKPINERTGVLAAIAITAGLLLMCIPQLAMGAIEAPRRYNEYPAGLQAWQVVSAMGGFLVVAGCATAFWSLLFGRRPTDLP